MPRIVPVLDLSRLEQGASEHRTFLFDLRTAARGVEHLGGIRSRYAVAGSLPCRKLTSWRSKWSNPRSSAAIHAPAAS